MESRKIKLYAQSNGNVALHAIPGHFSTPNSHINWYIDMTALKSRMGEAKQVGKHMAADYAKNTTTVDTIVCMDGTEMVGAFMAEEFDLNGYYNTNQHDTIYVVTPEYDVHGQIIFRDNTVPAVKGKNVIILLATTTTGATIRRLMSCIQYYGGKIQGISSIFSIVHEVDGIPVNSVFSEVDIPDYEAYEKGECPFCKHDAPIEAMVNGFGYSKTLR